MTECTSCAARPGEAAFTQRERGKVVLCDDCRREFRLRSETRVERPVLLTRAAWRARQRARLASSQADMLDWLSA